MTKAPRILYMGQEMAHDELPEPEVPLEAEFKPVTLSPKAVDLASQLVPEEHWKPLGIHTWLSRRADHVFRKMKVGETEGRLGRLKYFFTFANDEPILEKVVLD